MRWAKINIAVFIALLMMMVPVCFAQELAVSYDANGNLITGDGKFRVYNSLNQLSEIRNGSTVGDPLLESYSYHPTEERILTKKVYNTSGNVIETVIYVDDNFVRVTNSSGSFDYTYVKHEGQLVAQQNPDGTKMFVHGDLEGSTSTITNNSGGVVESTTYSPYGDILSGGNVSRFDYEGKEYSSVVGDYDFNSRKYNPEWAIFLVPDNIISNPFDPQGLNHYVFERNNPYNKVDPSGHIADCVVGCPVTGATVLYILIGAGIITIGAPLAGPKILESISDATKAYAKAGRVVSDVIDAVKIGEAIEEYHENPTPENGEKVKKLLLAAAINQAIAKGINDGSEAGKVASDVYSSSGGAGSDYHGNVPTVGGYIADTFYSKGSTSTGGGTLVFNSNKDKSALKDLAEMSSPSRSAGKTSGEIIKEWRKKYGRK